MRENLEFSLQLGGEALPEDVDALLAELGLAGYENVPARALSSGIERGGLGTG